MRGQCSSCGGRLRYADKEGAMFCSKCGAAVVEGASFCPACGQPVPGVGTGAVAAPASVPAFAPQPQVLYAGFWLRFVAWIIDRIVLQVAGSFIALPILISSGLLEIFRSHPPSSLEDMIPLLGTFFELCLFLLAVDWLYYALLESSAWQATLGKKALGLYVTDEMGRRASFGRVTGRFFGRIISGMIILIGFIMAGFTAKKQALHDMIASCLVLRKE